MRQRNPLHALFVLFLLLVPSSLALADRGIIDQDGGTYFVSPLNRDWSQLAFYGGHLKPTDFAKMNPDAIKAGKGRFQHFALTSTPDSTATGFFPAATFIAYDAEEVAKGNPRLRIYRDGDVVCYGITKGGGCRQPVDVGDERYIKFFITEYMRNGLTKSGREIPNVWAGFDNCGFRYISYGKTGRWDAPAPQNDEEWLEAIQRFFHRVKELAPDIKILCNEGSMGLESRYNDYVQDTDGVMQENLDRAGSEKFAELFTRYTRYNQHKVQALQVVTDDDAQLTKGYLMYLLLAGENGIFGPKDGNDTQIERARYARVKNALGEPVALATATGSGSAQLYQRATQGGWVYFNQTGSARTITLPAGRRWYSQAGNQVTTLTLAHGAADYVTTRPEALAAKPRIGPRRDTLVTGPLAVSIAADPGATIHYTLDGSEPTSTSPVYLEPLQLTASTTLKAKAYLGGQRPSHTTTARFQLTATAPTATFHLPQDYNSEFFTIAHPLVKLSHPAASPVTVSYRIVGGTATAGADYTGDATGVVTFQPGETYKWFPITPIDDTEQEVNETIEISLTSASNATLGAQQTYSYTIVDNDGAQVVYPAAIQAPTSSP